MCYDSAGAVSGVATVGRSNLNGAIWSLKRTSIVSQRSVPL